MIKEEYFEQTTDLNKISEIQAQYTYEDILLTDFELLQTEDGQLVMTFTDGSHDFADKDFDMTRQFLQSFCEISGIPYEYFMHIPYDLQKKNVDRLIGLRGGWVKVCFRGTTLVNIYKYGEDKDGNKTGFKVLDTSNLLEYFSSDKYRLRNCVIGDFGSIMDIVSSDLGTVSLIDKNEVFGIGYRLLNPFTMLGDKLSMSLFAEQEGTGNGYSLPTYFSTASLNLTKKAGEEDADYFDAFKNKIDKSIGAKFSLEEVRKAIFSLTGTKIKYRFLKGIMSKIKRLDENMFADVFGIKDWETEKDFFALKFEEEEAEDSSYEYFTVVNESAEYANGLGILLKMETETFISTIIKNRKKQEKLYGTDTETKDDENPEETED